MAIFVASGEISFSDKFEFAILNELLDFVFVSVFLTIDVKKCSHGGDEVPTRFQTAVDVVHGCRRHVVWHEDATGAAAVELAFELVGEDIDTIAEEEGSAICVPSFCLNKINEFRRRISSINIVVSLSMEHLSYHSCSAACVENPSIFWEGQSLVHLLSYHIFLGEVYDSEHLVVNLGVHIVVECAHLLTWWQIFEGLSQLHRFSFKLLCHIKYIYTSFLSKGL